MSDFEKKQGPAFFAAANSGKGFVSFYDEIFNSKEISRRYLIKGGPGTGKSTFMRRVAEEAEKRGKTVTYYHCSSDPSSLDGIIIDGNIAIIDSTAPHAIEPTLVGVRDTILDFGAFWDCDELALQVDKISLLSDKKSRAYALAYRFLSSAMQSDIASREIFLPYVDLARLKKTVRRLTRKIKRGAGYDLRIGLSSAIGMSGTCYFDSYECLASRTVYIEDRYGLGFLALSEICKFAQINQNKISVSYLPLCPDVPNVVYFEEEKLAFAVVEGKKKKAVSLRKVLDLSGVSNKEKRDIKTRARNAKKLSDALVLAACDELSLAGDAHFELEKVYRSAMDFSGLEVLALGIVEKL